MNNRIIILILLAVSFTGCLDSFEEINKDKNSIYVDKLLVSDLQKLIIKPQLEIYSSNPNMYQYAYNLHVDLFSGYMATPHSFNENSNNTYKLRPDFNHGPLETLLLKVIPNTRLVIQASEAKKLPHYAALARILQVISVSYATDTYGPVPYRSAKLGIPPYYFDSQEDIYNQMFEELESAVTDLTAYIKANPNAAAVDELAKFDKMCGADYTNWIKLANSLRLRLAMHIVKVNPDKARQIAEAAIAHEIGVFTSADSDIEIREQGIINPLWQMCDWDDTRINASFESIMKGYRHPAINQLIAPVSGNIIDTKGSPGEADPSDPFPLLHGVRMGISSVPGGKDSGNQYLRMSKCALAKESPLLVFKVAEVSFLKAEGTLRGWNMGGSTAEYYYKEGITTSLAKYKITEPDIINAYMETTTGGFPYKDLYDNSNSIPEGDPMLNDVPVKWDDTASNERKLQQIITQKWIANFPLSFEAWTEFRRTGYPKIFPVKINDSNGLIDTRIQIRRLPFAKQERDTNNDEVVKAEAFLKGPDTGGTRLWWDENKGNF